MIGCNLKRSVDYLHGAKRPVRVVEWVVKILGGVVGIDWTAISGWLNAAMNPLKSKLSTVTACKTRVRISVHARSP